MQTSFDIYPKKAQFLKNEPVFLFLELKNNGESKKNLKIRIAVSNLTKTTEEKSFEITLRANEFLVKEVELKEYSCDFMGFGADLFISENGGEEKVFSTAFDVVSNYKKAARYGFLSDFGPDENDDDDIKCLLKFHINLVQFYDWVYRHHDYIPKENIYSDMMGKPHSLSVLKRKTELCQKYGMKAIAYGAVYASGDDYFNKNPESGFYTSSGNVYKFIDIFNIMDISKESPWHEHIIGEYEKALKVMNFDGIHMDTYGFPKKGFSKVNGKFEEKHLEDLIPPLINDTKERLSKIKSDCCIVFNNVCNFPTDKTAKAKTDVIYIEVWKPYERYYHIKELIDRAKIYSEKKCVVLAAYLEPFRTSKNIEKAENAALLLTSLIFACGGFHLFVGENNAVLTQGYYPDYSLMRRPFAFKLRSYYDFAVRYSQILYDETLSDVSMTHSGGDNLEYTFKNAEVSPYPEPQRVFTLIKENKTRKVIHLINFAGNSEDFWNKEKNTPLLQKDIEINIEIERAPKSVYTASPDFNECRPQDLPFKVKESGRGKILNITLPKLMFFSSVIIDF